MAFSQNLRTRIAITPESTWGTTPATPAYDILPVTSFGLNLTKNELKDTAFHADRMQRYSLSGNSQVGGQIGVDVASNIADDLLAAALKGVWNADDLKVGTTDSSFTIEVGSTDTDLYSVYTGVRVDKATITIGLNDVVKATFDCIGKDVTFNTAATAGATYNAEPTSQPFTHFSGAVKLGGTTAAYLTGITFNIGSGTTADYVLASSTAAAITYGMNEISGTMTAYLVDNSLKTAFATGATSSVDVKVTDPANAYRQYICPLIKYTSVTEQRSTSGAVTLNIGFTALYDSTSGTVMEVKRG